MSLLSASLRFLTNARSQDVSVVDAAGDQVVSFGAGVQYTQGDVDATITGTAAMMEVAADTLQPVQGTLVDGLLVNLGANNDVTITGTVTVDSELPAAAALTDNFANPTAPAVGAFDMLWDGATWDRAPGSSTDGALVNLGANNDVTVTGSVDPSRPASAALTSVAASAISVSLLASNAARRQVIIVNDGNKTLYIAFAATTSTTAFTVRLGGGNEYVSELNSYTGAISGIWDSANGSARITEITT
jgi:hypothetical protein